MRSGKSTSKTRRAIKHCGRLILVLVLLAVIAAGVIYYVIGKQGSSGVEQWIGQRVMLVATNYLEPKLEFESLDYQHPTSVTLKKVRLVADGPNGKVNVVEVDEMFLQLAEIPRKGQPLRIERITVNKPVLNIVADPDGGFAGFNPLIRQGAAPEPSPDQPPLKLSETLTASLIEIKNGAATYHSADPELPAIRLDGLNTTLKIDPDAGSDYHLAAGIARDQAFDMKLDAVLQPDEGLVEVKDFTLDAQLTDVTIASLPPMLQQLIEKYEVLGRMQLSATAQVNINDMAKSEAQVKIRIDESGIKLGDERWSLDAVSAGLKMTPGQINLEHLIASGFGGVVEARGDIELNETLDAKLSFEVDAIQLGMIDKKYEGRVTLEGELTDQLIEPGKHLGGAATLAVREARLNNLPLLKQLSQFMDLVRQSEARETVDADIIFIDDRAYISKLNFKSDAIAARGKGNVHVDGKLDMLIKAGPLEKAEGLFLIGDILAMGSDIVLPLYRATGKIFDPKVSLATSMAKLETPYEKPEESGSDKEKVTSDK